MNSQQKLVRKFDFDNFKAPSELSFEDIKARPLTRQDLKDDLAGVNSSIETIQRTRGGSWPSKQLTEDFDFLDLAWHEREFRDNVSFAYVIRLSAGEYLGCFYLYPIGLRTALTKETEVYDVDASWWVTSQAYQNGYYEKLFKALNDWLTKFPFQRIYYSNKEIPKNPR